MKRRLLAGLAGLVLAAIGGVTLLTYVSHADARAMAGMESRDVLVVKASIPAGTEATALPELVVRKTIPATAVVPGTVTSLDSVAGLITTADLEPGEQLLSARFVDPASLKEADEIKTPAGMQQLSVSMERPRMLGSALTPGKTVGVLVSLAKDGEQPAQTHFILHKVLVTKVGEDSPAAPAGDEAPNPEPETSAPTESVVVTFAVTAGDAEKLLFGAEHGRLWLTLEPTAAATSGTEVVTAENVYR